jgi:hypothetical protein
MTETEMTEIATTKQQGVLKSSRNCSERNPQSFPMQDEPEAGAYFQCKMSLKGKAQGRW